MGAFADYLKRRMPRWLRGTWGDRWVEGVGGMLDAAHGGAKEAAKQHFIEECADDAVPRHAHDRTIDSVPGETYAQLRARAAAAWTTLSEMGPTLGLRNYMREVMQTTALEIYDVAVDNWLASELLSLEAYENASRLWLVIPQPHRWSVPVVGAGLVVGPGHLVGIDMTESELSLLRRVIREKRPTNMVPVEAYVLFDATTAAAVRANHVASSDFCRLPLLSQHVGYPGCDTVGPALVVGHTYT